jgi:hypothetical protein
VIETVEIEDAVTVLEVAALTSYLEGRARAIARIERDGEQRVGHAFLVQGALAVRYLVPDRRLVQEAALRKDQIAGIARIERQTRGLLNSALLRIIRRALRASMNAAAVEMGLEPSFALRSQSATDYLRTQSAQLVAGINGTTRAGLQKILAQSAEAGWAPTRTAQAIRDMYDGFATPQPQQHIRSRAHLIAVTETGNAYEEGNLAVGRRLADLGLAMEKSWLDLEDEREEQLCWANGREGWIPIEQKFSSGHDRPLAHPACRCALQIRRRPSPYVIASPPDNAPAPSTISAAEPETGPAYERILRWEDQHRSDPVESAFGVSPDGTVIYAGSQGHKSQVRFSPEEVARMADAVMTHNHPSGHAFSLDDLEMLHAARIAELRAARNGGGTVRATLTDKGRGLKKRDFLQWIRRVDGAIFARVLPKVQSGTIPLATADEYHADLLIETLVNDGLILAKGYKTAPEILR